MALLTVINNCFNPNDKTTSITKQDFIYKIVNEYSKDDIDIVVSLNGFICTKQDFTKKLNDNDFVAIVPIPQGGGGDSNKMLRTVAMIALIAVAPSAGAYLAGTMGVSVAVGSAIVMSAGSYLINEVLPPNIPKQKANDDLSTVSPTYSFTGGSNAMIEGTALPIMLGKARVIPPIISSYLSLKDDKQYVNILYALNDGLIDDVTSTKINDQDSSNYTGISLEHTKGTNTQSPIGNFRDTITTFNINTGLNSNDATTIYTTSGNANNELEVVIGLNRGLFNVSNSGDYNSYVMKFKIEYKKHNQDDSAYQSLQAQNIYRDYTAYHLYWDFTGGEDEEWTEQVRTSNKTTLNDELNTSKVYYNTTADYPKNQNYRQNILNYQTPNDTQEIRTVYKTPKKLSFVISNLDSSKYDIKITRIANFSDSTRVSNNLSLDYINEIIYDDFTYPNVALLSLKALATDQLNGSFPKLSCIVDTTNSISTDLISRPLSNPAWAVYKVLKDANISDENINISKFETWATYCNSNNLTVNLYIDSSVELQNILNMISVLGRAIIIQFGAVFTPVLDIASSIPTQGFIFTSANMIDSSFNMSLIPYENRANIIETTYYDKDDDYKPKTITLSSDDYNSSSIDNKSSIKLYGCTDKTQAQNYTKFLLNKNKYISKTISFIASTDSIVCTIGDIIKVGVKYFTNTICEGRVQEYNNNTKTIKLDNSVSLEENETYQIDYRISSSDEIISHTFTSNTLQTTQDVIVNDIQDDKAPSKYDIFSIGKLNNSSTDNYRVVSITKNDDMTRKISAIEYNESVYNDSTNIVVETTDIISEVYNIEFNDSLVKNSDGSIDEILTISFITNNLENNFYINGDFKQKLFGNSIELKNTLISGQSYDFQIGQNRVSYFYAGLEATPTSVQNVSMSYSNGAYNLSWDKNEDIDFKLYEININGAIKQTTTNSLKIDDLDYGSYDVDFYSVDTRDNKSIKTTYNLQVNRPCFVYLIRDSSLIQKAFLDGTMTIYVSNTLPTTANKYDILKSNLSNLRADEFTFDEESISGYTFDGNEPFYRYYTGTQWNIASSEQIAVINRCLGQLTQAGISDNEVKVFSTQPYPPYDINDIYIQDTNIYICNTSKSINESYSSIDFTLSSKDSLSIATKIENIKTGA